MVIFPVSFLSGQREIRPFPEFLRPVAKLGQTRRRALNGLAGLQQHSRGVPGSIAKPDARSVGHIDVDDEISAADRLLFEIDSKLSPAIDVSRILKTRDVLSGDAQARDADRHAIVCKNFAEAFSDDHGDAPSPQSLGRMFTRRAAAEIPIGQRDVGAPTSWIVERMHLATVSTGAARVGEDVLS